MSSINHQACLGPHARRKLRKASPFASLLLDVSSALSSLEVSQIKLILQVDKIVPRKKIYQSLHSADLIGLLEGHGLISSTDTHFLEHILVQIGRKDLEKVVLKYHQDRNKREGSTIPKQVIELSSFTQLRPTSLFGIRSNSLSPIMESQKMALLKQIPVEELALIERPGIEGCSYKEEVENVKPCSSSTGVDGLDSSQESMQVSQSSVTFSMSQDRSSQMSISDDEKMAFL